MIENRQGFEAEREKSPVLYHGTSYDHIKELEPKRKSYRDEGEGELLFATPSLEMASVFMAESKHYGSGLHNGIPYAYFIEPREEFLERDKGGYIYILPGDKFKSDPQKGLGEYEWTSEEKVKPVGKIEYPSVLDAMIKNGVQVYFMNEETYRRIEESED